MPSLQLVCIRFSTANALAPQLRTRPTRCLARELRIHCTSKRGMLNEGRKKVLGSDEGCITGARPHPSNQPSLVLIIYYIPPQSITNFPICTFMIPVNSQEIQRSFDPPHISASVQNNRNPGTMRHANLVIIHFQRRIPSFLAHLCS